VEDRSAQQIWEAALGELQIQVSRANYRTWLEKTTGLSYKDGEFVVGAPNTFVAEYLDKKQRSLIEKALINLTKERVGVTFQVNGHLQSAWGYRTAQKESPRLNPKYTFDSFIAGDGNRLALAAAKGVIEKPGDSYNPLFIHGGPGLGKTHLLQAIGHAAQAHNVKVLYVSAEQFTNELMKALRERKTEEFRNKYRSVDLLLIDDIHFFSGKEQTEENFFHTFNTLHNANHQIVAASDRPPRLMSLLQERLRTRLEWGLIADIQPPDLQTRLEILQAKAEQQGANITLDILELIARRAQQNVRELEGLLNRIIAYARLTKAAITPKLAAEALRDIASRGQKSSDASPAQLLEAVASSFQLSPSDLKSPGRKQFTLAREVAAYLMRQEINCPLSQIGEEMGGRDASFASRACRKIASEINSSPSLKCKVEDIQQNLSSTLL